MFSEELAQYDWEETSRRIASKRPADVEAALGKEHPTLDDFMALVSPAAAAYLEPMARLSRRYTQERFGKTISMYIPMYITNSCTNSCVYCGFNRHNAIPRVILTPEQIEAECRAIRELGPFENLLLVTGENPRAAGVDYIEQALRICRPWFNNLTIEVMPLAAEEYERLTHAGLNGVVCFQETYNRKNYNIYHPAGMKSKFEWRVNGFDRMGQAGPLTLFLLFQAHYFQRSFIFPLLIRGNSKMPLGIVLMGMVFNTLNALMQGGWVFWVSPDGYYDNWFSQPWIYIGGALFIAGMAINLHSDRIIRHLRQPGDTRHYIPRGGMFRYVSSANYFGELLEWVGFAVASWSWAGAVFAWWTFANLAPRAASLRRRYEREFGEEFSKLRRKRIIPFIY